MLQTADRQFLSRQNPAIEPRVSEGSSGDARYATNRVEQLLILATVALLPLQEYIGSIGGFSIMYLLFAAQAVYLLAKRPECIAKTWLHPLLLAVYIFLLVGMVMEFIHTNSNYDEIFRMAQTFSGSILLGALCRDRKGLRMAMYGYVAQGLLLAINLLFNYNGSLAGSTAVDYGEAERVRAAVFEENPLQYNLNGMAFCTAQGAGVALALALTSLNRRAQYCFFGIAFACFLASFLPMSRSGIAILVGVCASVVLKYGITRIKTLLIAVIASAVLVVLVPPAVWSRLAISTDVNETTGRMEGRAEIYSAFFHHFAEFAVEGVGVGNYFGDWGQQSLYGNGKGKVSGAHNVFFQMMIYWGIPAILALIGIVWQGYHCLPGRSPDDGLAIGMVCVSVSLLFWSLTVHNLYAKEFSMGIGLLVAGRQWIWPVAVGLPLRRPRVRQLQISPDRS
jgi:hypothetical protein